LALVAVGVIVVLALVSTAAQATDRGRIATACSNETVNAGFGNVTVRFVLHGKVSCTEAHRTMRAYARAIADGRCTSEICTEVVFAGGWTCSATIPVLQRPNLPIWGCERRGASFDVYKVIRGAGNQPSWHTVALQSAFPVYRPRQTLGLKLSLLKLTPCSANTRFLVANYGNSGSNKGPHVHLYESSPEVCGNPGEASPVTKAAINGVNVQVSVYCNLPVQKCTIKDGFSHGFLLVFSERGAKRTAIALDSIHVSLSDFLKVARSFTKVPR
jgi:hypothetical protein